MNSVFKLESKDRNSKACVGAAQGMGAGFYTAVPMKIFFPPDIRIIQVFEDGTVDLNPENKYTWEAPIINSLKDVLTKLKQSENLKRQAEDQLRTLSKNPQKAN